MTFKNMLITTSTWAQGKAESFKLIPLSKDCPFVDSFFDPFAQTLVVTSSQTQDQFTTLERLEETGEVKKNKLGKTLVDRIRVANNKQYFIDKSEEIKEFINLVALNADTYDYTKYLSGEIIKPEMEVIPAEKLATADLS